MEVADELSDYSYRKIWDDGFKEKKVYYKIYKIFLLLQFIWVLNLHISKEGKNLLEYHSKEESPKLHFFYMFSDYVMFLFKSKRCYSCNFHLLVMLQQHLLISWDKNLINMFVSISNFHLLKIKSKRITTKYIF